MLHGPQNQHPVWEVGALLVAQTSELAIPGFQKPVALLVVAWHSFPAADTNCNIVYTIAPSSHVADAFVLPSAGAQRRGPLARAVPFADAADTVAAAVAVVAMRVVLLVLDIVRPAAVAMPFRSCFHYGNRVGRPLPGK